MTLARFHALAIFSATLVLCTGCGPKGLRFPTSPKMAAPPPVAAPPVVPAIPPPEAVAQHESLAPAPPEDSAALEKPEAAPPSQVPGDAPNALYSDSFANMQGSIYWNKNGEKSSEGLPRLRTIYAFNGVAEGGPFEMKVLEDAETRGPNGEPGVLALSWHQIPPKLSYSGFVYLGGVPVGRMTLPQLKEARSVDDLRGMRIKFRYRGVNPNLDIPVKLSVDCRLEPQLPDSFNKRLDLGTLTATDEWSTLEMPLNEGKNMESFLKMLAEENPPQFKIVWGQTGPLSNYHNGDTLLIDDIVISKDSPD
jgi:hypothetical protein